MIGDWSKVSQHKAPVGEGAGGPLGWSAKHFYACYRKDGGARSYMWVQNRLQEEELVLKAKARGVRRKRRERSL